jgi:hypothetical protein
MIQPQFLSCLEACRTCATACDVCASLCLKEADVTPMAKCIALDVDCADVCRFAAAAMGRGSDFTNEICRMCADICDACADECAKHAAPHCQDCAQACRRCAQECRAMEPGMIGRQPSTVSGVVSH